MPAHQVCALRLSLGASMSLLAGAACRGSDRTATDWPRVLRRMWLRMDRMPDSLESTPRMRVNEGQYSRT
jgi:hypothetical protein